MKLVQGKHYFVTYTDHTGIPKKTELLVFIREGLLKGKFPILVWAYQNKTHIMSKGVVLVVHEAVPDKMYAMGWKDTGFFKGKRLQLEAAYPGNMGVMEIFRFYQIASPNQKNDLERFIDRDDYKSAWALVQKVTKTKLMGPQFENFKYLVSTLKEIRRMTIHD